MLGGCTWDRGCIRSTREGEEGRLQRVCALVVAPFQQGCLRYLNMSFLFCDALNDYKQDRHEKNPQSAGGGHARDHRTSQHLSTNGTRAFRCPEGNAPKNECK